MTTTEAAMVTLTEAAAHLNAHTCADDIAAMLAREGITGRRRDPTGCALAVWFRRRTGRAVEMGASMVVVDASPDRVPGPSCATLTMPVRGFVVGFDTGAYPMLDLPDDGHGR